MILFMEKTQLKKISKKLSAVLRHKPESIGLKLDSAGWASVDSLLSKVGISREVLEEVVLTNDKKRFSFSDDGLMIRANQGHSVQGVDLKLQPETPPDTLYHGTVERFADSIRSEGLKKMSRHHVHLSATKETALNVGSRRGKPILLTIDARAMQKTGYKFYLSANGVWLTDHVPARYITFL